ncbi:MAG TPA: SpoIIE family protein phosphatase [Terriglobales bacterium]|nr:SpoIIE family protein phosphatase [Terriglobales bacterium]
MASTSHIDYKAHKCSFHPERQDPYVRLGAATVYVRDQERSLRFYREKLGFELAFDTLGPCGDRWLTVSPPDGTALITLAEAKPDSEEYKLIGRPTEIVFLTDNVPAKFREWRERGVRFHYDPRCHAWGAVSTSFEDLDGNSFQLLSIDQVISEVAAERSAHVKRHEAELRAAHDLELARQVQSRLFPQIKPMVNTLEYAGTCVQARHVGGDYYDFLDLGNDRLGLLIADVSGKGTAAALGMANLQAHLHNQIETYWSRPYVPMVLNQPERFLRSVNSLFHGNTTEEVYATLFFAEYDDKQARLRYANCGHLAGVLLRADGTVESLDSTCTAVGLFKDFNCVADERNLVPGDTLALYTDGVTEAVNEAGEEFGQDRLVHALISHRELPSHIVLSTLLDEVRQFGTPEQQDDITMVVARCRRT